MSAAEDLFDDRRHYPFISPAEERRMQAELRMTGPSLLSDGAEPVTVVDRIESGLRDLARSLGGEQSSSARSASVHPINAAVAKAHAGAARRLDREGADYYAPRSTRSSDQAVDVADDLPVFLRQAGAEPVVPMSTRRRPVERPSVHHPDLPRSLDPVPIPALPRPQRVVQKGPSGPSMVSLLLGYAVFLLMPLTAWVSDMVDPRIAAAAPAIYFAGWLTIHGWRGDQIAQLRILAAWQIFQMVSSLYAMRPGSAVSHGGIYWSAAMTATCAALLVVAISAIIEASEFRSVRIASKLPPLRAPAARPARAN